MILFQKKRLKLWKLFPAVTAFRLRNKFLVFVLRASLRVVKLFYAKKRAQPPLFFHDDPLRFNFSDIIYFAYKYYLQPPVLDDAGGATAEFFKTHPPDFADSAVIYANLRQKKTVTITAAGDIMPYEWIQKKYCSHLWNDIVEDFFSSDIVFANLETPIDTSQPPSLVPELMLTDMLFNANEEMFSVINPDEVIDKNKILTSYITHPIIEKFSSKRKFDVLSTANNHALDMGEAGIEKTINFLKEKNIFPTGTAFKAEEKFDYPVIDLDGLRVAFISFTYSMNKFRNPEGKDWLVNHIEINQPDAEVSPITELVRHAREKKNVDFVVLGLHFSNAYQIYPAAHILENVKKIFSHAGPDAILGNHAHHIQPSARFNFVCPFTQILKAGFVNFACGDFIAYDIFNWGHLTMYLKLYITKGINTNNSTVTFLENVEFKPVYICGTYKSKDNRDLRLLDAEKLNEKIKNKNVPGFLTPYHLKEFKALKNFYETYFMNYNNKK